MVGGLCFDVVRRRSYVPRLSVVVNESLFEGECGRECYEQP
jgi:hypothetical protein